MGFSSTAAMVSRQSLALMRAAQQGRLPGGREKRVGKNSELTGQYYIQKPLKALSRTNVILKWLKCVDALARFESWRPGLSTAWNFFASSGICRTSALDTSSPKFPGLLRGMPLAKPRVDQGYGRRLKATASPKAKGKPSSRS